MIDSACDGLCCCIYPVLVSNTEPQSGDAVHWSASHLLRSAQQWEPSGFCAVSKRYVDQYEGKLNNGNF